LFYIYKNIHLLLLHYYYIIYVYYSLIHIIWL